MQLGKLSSIYIVANKIGKNVSNREMILYAYFCFSFSGCWDIINFVIFP
jgi:hypothetical protein